MIRVWWLALLAFADWSAIERQISAARYREALARLETENTRSAAWHVLASKAYDGLNDPARAVAEAEAALQIDSRHEAAHVQLGYIFLSRNTPLAAVEIFTEAEQMFPESTVVRLGKGLALKELQRYDEAEKTLGACWPHPLAFDALATVLVRRGKFGEAKDFAARFIQAQPGDYRGYYFLAAAKDGLQEKDAKEAVKQSLARKADFAASHALLGKIQLRDGELQAAAASLEQAIRYRPDLVQAHLQLGQTYRRLGRDDDAAREFAIVRQLNEKEAQPKPSLRYHRGGGTQK
jgi:tetratricopeptide (TPR) repeat protein